MNSHSVPSETKNELPTIVTQFDDSDQPPTATPSPVAPSTRPLSKITIHSSSGDTKINMQENLTTPHADESNPFAFLPEQLSALMDPKNIDLLSTYGGVEGVARGLHADIHKGLSDKNTISTKVDLTEIINKLEAKNPFTSEVSQFEQRKSAFGVNVLPDIKSKNIFQLMWMAFKDKMLILLAVAAVVSLAVGIYESVGHVEYDAQGNKIQSVEWVEGVAIIVAIIIVVLAGSINDFQKEKQFRKLNAKKEERSVKVTRDGIISLLSVHDVLVGDILHLEPGDIVACDGIFIEGHNMKCDESAATGESDAVRKQPWDVCYRAMYGHNEKENENEKPSPTFLAPPSPTIQTKISSSSLTSCEMNKSHTESQTIRELHRSYPDPFIISGSRVLEGRCTYLVTGIGVHSYHGRTMMALRTEPEMTPLQKKLNGLAGMIAKLGSIAAILMLIALLIRYFVGFRHGVPTEAAEIVSDVMSILIVVITVIVVAVPEGLPLAVTLALAYATQRMLKDNNLVRVLASCETMGNATTICSDKTGTLTQNKMTVVAGSLGLRYRFAHDPTASQPDVHKLDEVATSVPKEVSNLLNQAIAVNSSVFQSEDDNGAPIVVGNKTESALVNFSSAIGAEHFETIRANYQVEQLYPFSSDRKAMATVIRVPQPTGSHVYRAHVKGASEIIVSHCSSIVSLEPGKDGSVTTRSLTDQDRQELDHLILSYANRSLRTIAIGYRDFTRWPSNQKTASGEDVEVPYENIVEGRGLTLLAIIGIQDPLRPGVKEAVSACQKAGVTVRMVTGDNIMTAKSIAEQCGIYTPGGVVMEGPVFRHLPQEEMDQIIPRLQVLARSSPEDKRILVGRLKELGETVAVTGDGTNDGPALKLADVGFSMGISGTEVAKEASSIILMDDNFSSIVKALMWGRCVNDSVRKFLEFQLTVNVTAVILTFISGVASENQRSVLTAVQLLWVNLIMDTFAALALATDPPTEELLCRNPDPKSAPLISLKMWKQILGQSIFQIVVTFALLYGNILDYHPEDIVLQTIVFNTFVFCQIFNEINCRRIDSKLNVFHNILANKFFLGIFALCVVLQAIIVNFGDSVFQVTQIDGPSWAIAIVVGMFSLPVGAAIRLIPDRWFGFLFRNPETRKRYLGDEYNGPVTPDIYMTAGIPSISHASLDPKQQ